MDIIFCAKCGNEVENNARFCNKCGEPTTLEDRAVLEKISPSGAKRSVLIAVIAGMVLIMFAIYVYMAWLPPSFSKSMKAIQNLNSYKQDIRVSVPDEYPVELHIKTDKQKKLAAVTGTFDGENIELYLEENRLLIGDSYYDRFWEVILDDNKYNAAKMKAYTKALQDELNPVFKVLSKQIIKANSNTEFRHTKVNTPAGDIKVKQYNIKMDADQFSQAVIDFTTRLGNDHIFREHINAAYGTSIDYLLDVGKGHFDEYDYETLNDSREECNENINVIVKALDEDKERRVFRKMNQDAQVSVELQMSFDYRNRPVEVILTVEAEEEVLTVKSLCHDFDRPVRIDLPDSSNIKRLN